MNAYHLNVLKDNSLHDSKLVFLNNGHLSELDFQMESVNIQVKDEFPFFALLKLRMELEKNGYLILCNGSRKDVYPSGNSVVGIMAYELQLGKQATKLVCIFDGVNNIERIGTVNDQKLYREKWLSSLT